VTLSDSKIFNETEVAQPLYNIWTSYSYGVNVGTEQTVGCNA